MPNGLTADIPGLLFFAQVDGHDLSISLDTKPKLALLKLLWQI